MGLLCVMYWRKFLAISSDQSSETAWKSGENLVIVWPVIFYVRIGFTQKWIISIASLSWIKFYCVARHINLVSRTNSIHICRYITFNISYIWNRKTWRTTISQIGADLTWYTFPSKICLNRHKIMSNCESASSNTYAWFCWFST